jgi:hypothetical protein
MVVPGKRGVGTVAYQPSSSGQNFLTVELGRCIVGSLRRISLSGWRCLISVLDSYPQSGRRADIKWILSEWRAIRKNITDCGGD